MKSVGEAMAIGRNFTEALQKALRSLEKKGTPVRLRRRARRQGRAAGRGRRVPTDGRINTVSRPSAPAPRHEEVFDATKIDPWFVDQLFLIKEIADELAAADELDPELLAEAKRHGFSDAQIAEIRGAARGRRPRGAARARRPPGLQDGRHLRRRVRRADAVLLLLLRRGDRGRAARASPR